MDNIERLTLDLLTNTTEEANENDLLLLKEDCNCRIHSNFRKNLIYGTIVDARDSKFVNFDKNSKETFAKLISETAFSDFEDDMVEEICALLLAGFDGLHCCKEMNLDYELLHQLRLGVENGVDISPIITSETSPAEALKIRLKLQNEQSASIEDDEDEDEESEDAESEEEVTSED